MKKIYKGFMYLILFIIGLVFAINCKNINIIYKIYKEGNLFIFIDFKNYKLNKNNKIYITRIL